MNNNIENHSIRLITKNNEQGFSLLEILVAGVLVALLSVIITNSLFSLIRGVSKTDRIKEIKQNGDFTLGVIERKIRNSLDVTSACLTTGSNDNTITIINSDNTTQTIYSCVSDSGVRRIQESVENISTGVTISTDFLTNTSITVYGDCTTSNILFRCIQDPITLQKQVTVSMTLGQSNAVSTSEEVTETFETQIQLRN